MRGVDFIITSFNRFNLLEKLIDSIYLYYPNAHILIGDQSKLDVKILERIGELKIKYPKAVFYSLPYDCGLSATRNFLMKKSRRQYKLLLEDDFLFCDEANVGEMLELMKLTKCSVVGGAVYQGGHELSFDFNFKIVNGELYQVKLINNWQKFKDVYYRYSQCVMNFTLFDSKVFKDIEWDEELKLREHQDFYLRLSKTKHRVVFLPSVKIIDNKHSEPVTPEYTMLKARDNFMIKMMNKHGLTKIHYYSGAKYTLKNNKLIFS